jgi:hypothetical protein
MIEPPTERRADTRELRIQVAEMSLILRQLEGSVAALDKKVDRYIASYEATQPGLAVHLAEWSALKPQLLAVLDMVQRGKGVAWLVPVLVALAGMVAAAYAFLSTHTLIPRS